MHGTLGKMEQLKTLALIAELTRLLNRLKGIRHAQYGDCLEIIFLLDFWRQIVSSGRHGNPMSLNPLLACL